MFKTKFFLLILVGFLQMGVHMFYCFLQDGSHVVIRSNSNVYHWKQISVTCVCRFSLYIS